MSATLKRRRSPSVATLCTISGIDEAIATNIRFTWKTTECPDKAMHLINALGCFDGLLHMGWGTEQGHIVFALDAGGEDRKTIMFNGPIMRVASIDRIKDRRYLKGHY